ncbi:MAG TPA: L-type lectin-domain containing protein [Gemmataceae bacterium]|nr:L-type lectin-domain containing protein [Gemmataceae bacterium]
MIAHTLRCCILVAAFCLTSSVLRADFIYSNFSSVNSTSGSQVLQLNGNAALVGNVLRLTASAPYQSGSAFTTNAISLGSNASFSTYFQFNLSSSAGISDGDGPGADGIVFVVQTVSNTAGGAGGGIGYQGLTKSLGVEFDTYNNGEISGNHVGVDENGGLQDFAAINEPTRFNNGQTWNAWIDYDGVADQLQVRWSLSTTRPVLPMLTLNSVDLPALLGQNNAFVGFTAGTGSGYNNQDILDWQFNQSFQPIGDTQVPEPVSIAIFGCVAISGAFFGCRRRKAVA